MTFTRLPDHAFSESAFEAFCQQEGLPCFRVPEGRQKTPDYLVRVGRCEIVVEIKETEKNKEEEESDRVLAATGVGLAITTTVGAKVRAMISAASSQIKARSDGRHPSLLVLFDRGMVAGHCGADHIRAGMYGFDQLVIALPADRSQRSFALGWKHGPKRKMTPDSNTSISAIAVLFVTGPDQPFQLAVYHNDFAAVPLKPALLSPFAGVTQYRLGQMATGERTRWVEIVRSQRTRAPVWWLIACVIIVATVLLTERLFLLSR